MTGSYLYYPTPFAAPMAPGVAGEFGRFGQYEWIAPTIAAVTTAAATTYQLSLQAKAAKTMEHQAERDAAASATLAAQQAAQQQTAAVQQAAGQQAALMASGGAAPSGAGILAQLQGVPMWVWGAAAGGLVLLMVMRRK